MKSHYKTHRFLEQTIITMVSLLKETIVNEELALRNGYLQRRDPRLKCLSFALILICILLVKNSIALFGLYLACLAATAASGINLVVYLKRTWLFIPFFSLFIILPALFNIVTPGEPVFTFSFFSYHLSVTRQGIDAGITVFLRVLSSVSFAILLVLTTRHHVLLKVLRLLKIPQLFVTTISMAYRYIYLLLDIARNTFLAIKSRVGYITSAKTGRRIIGTTLSGLWLKSYRLQTDVYTAMVSRGYSGEPMILDEFRTNIHDIVLLFTSIMALIGTVWLNAYSP
jgi:cobalt/nickel transport system permease protein